MYIALVGIQYALVHHSKSTLAWGTIPDWVIAIGNLAVLATAFEAIRRDRKRLRALEAEHQRRREETDLERASYVSAWPEDWSDHDVHVVCHNGCAEPIYDVVLRVAEKSSTAPPTAADHEDTKSAFLMRPGENLETTLRLSGTLSGEPRIDMSFRDTRGHCWWRQPDGMVVQFRNAVIQGRSLT